MENIEYQKCNICFRLKKYNCEYFSQEKNNKNGLSGTCISCRTIKRKIRDDKLKNSIKPELETLTCSVCKLNKPATTEYFHRHSRSTTGFKNSCKSCRKLETHKYNISDSCKAKAKFRRKNDNIWKLKKNISSTICNSLRNRNSSKEGSCFKYLGYTVEELKTHLESQFEEWMNWDNWGQISNERKTWNIDHIYPQSKLPYDSMIHPNFIKCWSLSNLRPISATENIKKKDKIIY